MDDETSEEMRDRIRKRTEKAEQESQRTYAEEIAIRRNIRIARKLNQKNMAAVDKV